MKLDNPPNQTPITSETVQRPWQIFFQQIVANIRGGDIPVIRTAPDGTRYRLEVNNGGTSNWIAL